MLMLWPDFWGIHIATDIESSIGTVSGFFENGIPSFPNIWLAGPKNGQRWRRFVGLWKQWRIDC